MAVPASHEDVLLTVQEVAHAMRVSPMTVYRLIKTNKMTAIRVGNRFRIRARDLRGYLEKQTVGRQTWPVG